MHGKYGHWLDNQQLQFFSSNIDNQLFVAIATFMQKDALSSAIIEVVFTEENNLYFQNLWVFYFLIN